MAAAAFTVANPEPGSPPPNQINPIPIFSRTRGWRVVIGEGGRTAIRRDHNPGDGICFRNSQVNREEPLVLFVETRNQYAYFNFGFSSSSPSTFLKIGLPQKMDREFYRRKDIMSSGVLLKSAQNGAIVKLSYSQSSSIEYLLISESERIQKKAKLNQKRLMLCKMDQLWSLIELSPEIKKIKLIGKILIFFLFQGGNLLLYAS